MEKYIQLLYKLARKAARNGDVPVSAIILKNDRIIATGYNNRQKKSVVLGHAEVNAIIKAVAGVSGIESLPVGGGVILVIISMVLTIIAGLIPSKMASKKDPVEALRTE